MSHWRTWSVFPSERMDGRPSASSGEAMRIGVVFPQTEFGDDPIALRDYAQTVEGLGFTHFLAYDHVLGADTSVRPGWSGPYTERPASRRFTFSGTGMVAVAK